MDRDSSRGRNTVPGSIPSRGHPDGRGRRSSARAKIEPGTRFRRRAPGRLIGELEGGGDQEPTHHDRAGNASEWRGLCVSTNRDTRGEATRADSACETRLQDERFPASRLQLDARSRTPSADPVEAAGAATKAEHASESERADGVGTDATQIGPPSAPRSASQSTCGIPQPRRGGSRGSASGHPRRADGGCCRAGRRPIRRGCRRTSGHRTARSTG